MPNDIRPGELVELSPRVRRLTQNNPGPFTGPGTNTHLVGDQAIFILDPGQEDEAHLRGILEGVAGRQVAAILPTHAHPDHWPLSRHLAEVCGAPVWAFAERNGLVPDRLLSDGEVLASPGTTLEVLHTPGHASDHLCFRLVEERALFSGDLVMGWSTSVISPPDGNLQQFLQSLVRLEHLEMERMYPAHGPPIEHPHARVQEIYRHRQMRTEQALEALAEGRETLAALAERIYPDVDPRLRAAAQMSLLAHLEALQEEGRVTVTGEGEAARYRLS